jgi:hypothetical protein
MKLVDGCKGSAEFSFDGKLRYVLTRDWSGGAHPSKTRSMITIGLNPSKADGSNDDLTIRKCIGFARRNECKRLVMLNVYPWVSTDPGGLAQRDTKRDAEADPYIIAACAETADRSPLVVAAWGASGWGLAFDNRVRTVVSLVRSVDKDSIIMCFGRTESGLPRHPSRLAYATPLEMLYPTGEVRS